MKKLIFLFLISVNLIFAISFEEAKKIEKEQGVLASLNSYKVLASQNNVNAIFKLALIYANGKEVEQSLIMSKKYLEKGSLLKHNKSSYYLAKLYLSKKTPYYNLAKAFNTFLEAAKRGYAPAQNMIGQFLATGTVVDTDYKKAVEYFEKASKQGYIEAHCNLAFMYASGKGVFPNFGRAHQFAKKGIKVGNKKCQKVWDEYNLAKYDKDKGWKFNFYTKPK
ncbi:MAG: tetratricopeptide repeat protein [Halarcobacter sp.]